MAIPGEIGRGDTVLWPRRYSGDVVGVVVRCAKDGTWCDVRYPIPPSNPFPDITHLTRRVRITKLRLVRKAGAS